MEVNMSEYKGFYIMHEVYGGKEYTVVQYCGDEVVFSTEDEAKAFIDEIS